MPDITIRPAASADDDWLYRLHEAAHRDLVERAYGPWREDQQRCFFAALRAEHVVHVMVDGAERVGAVYLGERDGDTWLELVEVAPAEQGRGLGGTALRWVTRRAASRGRGTLLQVHRVNDAARRLYLREGFVPAGETATHHLLRHG